jgi:hypothetical protein
MTVTIEPYEVEVTGEVYQVIREPKDGAIRIFVFNNGQLRFSLAEGIPPEEVRKFIQVYALGFADGQRASSIEDRIRTRLHDTARRLGRAAGGWKVETK